VAQDHYALAFALVIFWEKIATERGVDPKDLKIFG
jgi:hypothetical protein